MKNIVICCDGTGAEYGRHNSNVVKLYQRVVRDSGQTAFYDPGVGTFSFLGRNLGRRAGIMLGKAFGAGTQLNIEDAYRYLMERYRNGDRVFLFGFNRGAFTVRALAGMLHKCGLLQRGSNDLIPYASRIYNRRGNEDVAAGFKDTYCHECKPHFIGVWDTVGSMGWFWGRKFFDAALNEDVAYGFHAVAVDERRSKFPVSLWDESRKTRAGLVPWLSFRRGRFACRGGAIRHRPEVDAEEGEGQGTPLEGRMGGRNEPGPFGANTRFAEGFVASLASGDTPHPRIFEDSCQRIQAHGESRQPLPPP